MLYEDESIDTGDEDAQAKLEKYLSGKSDDLKKRFNTDFNTTEVYAAGNALVFELDYTKDADEEILGDASKMMEEMYKTEKEYQKSYWFNTIMTIIFYPLFKIIEMFNK